jgi:hypothetical protein
MCSAVVVDQVPDACGGPCSQPSQVCYSLINLLLTLSAAQVVTVMDLVAAMMLVLLRVKVKNNSARLGVVVEITYVLLNRRWCSLH